MHFCLCLHCLLPNSKQGGSALRQMKGKVVHKHDLKQKRLLLRDPEAVIVIKLYIFIGTGINHF